MLLADSRRRANIPDGEQTEHKFQQHEDADAYAMIQTGKAVIATEIYTAAVNLFLESGGAPALKQSSQENIFLQAHIMLQIMTEAGFNTEEDLELELWPTRALPNVFSNAFTIPGWIKVQTEEMLEDYPNFATIALQAIGESRNVTLPL